MAGTTLFNNRDHRLEKQKGRIPDPMERPLEIFKADKRKKKMKLQ